MKKPTMTKRTILDRIEIDAAGSIGLRFARQIVEGDGTVLASHWHRTMLSPGDDIDAQIAAVNDHLTGGLNGVAVSAEDVDRVKAVAAPIWTAEVIDAHQQRVAAAEQQLLAVAAAQADSPPA